ncbi:hypothetical protein KY285_035007 [Solanum tuberosum]|nr:hypothetical protein KY285_035007 [Solanum tuberosum]
MPKIGYVKFIKENCFIENARFKAIHWLIKSQRRWNLSFGTVFGAASYLDQFISLNKCQEWKYWMFELLSIACLSVASKFHETSPPQLLELQMEGVGHLFESTMIQRMELALLETLGWRLNSTTPYSYIELFQWSINSLKTVNDLLLRILLDAKFLEFRPCVIAQSVVTCISEDLSLLIDDSCFNNFTRLIPQDQKAAKVPAGVELPKEVPKLSKPLLGFTNTAEIWNSRACMIGLIGTFIVELIFNKGILEMIGVEIGKGLDIPL